MAICVSKRVILVCVISYLVSVHLIGGLDARKISYRALGRNIVYVYGSCSKLHPKNCKLLPSNPYQRGCVPESRCRDHYAPPGIGDDSDGNNKRNVVHDPSPQRHGGHHHHHHGKKKQTSKIRGSHKVIPFPPN